MKTKGKKLKNTVYVVEATIDNSVLKALIDHNDTHPDKVAVIQECVEELKKNFPEMEIFKVGPDYIVTETSMYIALFEDEIIEE